MTPLTTGATGTLGEDKLDVNGRLSNANRTMLKIIHDIVKRTRT